MMGRIAMGFRRRGFVVHVRRFRKVQKKQILSGILKALNGCRLKE